MIIPISEKALSRLIEGSYLSYVEGESFKITESKHDIILHPDDGWGGKWKLTFRKSILKPHIEDERLYIHTIEGRKHQLCLFTKVKLITES